MLMSCPLLTSTVTVAPGYPVSASVPLSLSYMTLNVYVPFDVMLLGPLMVVIVVAFVPTVAPFCVAVTV